MRNICFLFVVVLMALVGVSASAETLEQNFFHQLKIGEPAQSWEHRIDLPESAAMHGRVFVGRNLDLRMGKLVIEREMLTPTFYYVKVRLPKHPEVPMAGNLKVELLVGDVISDKKPEAPASLVLSPVGATLKPIFTWKTNCRYAAVTLFDVTSQQTVWERVATKAGYIGFDEGYLKKDHHYRWAVKVSDVNGRYSGETLAGFKIVEQNGVVVAVPE
ncbi:MAG: hypothetical protein PHD82_11585 [Candidatus Riflebacteria bacterium]|nr:hypothetical protein [Candidatus Riflebacteria bacterium]